MNWSSNIDAPYPKKCISRIRRCFCFQAEDCRRDFHVTGVQTCALPIFGYRKQHAPLAGEREIGYRVCVRRWKPAWLRFGEKKVAGQLASLVPRNERGPTC